MRFRTVFLAVACASMACDSTTAPLERGIGSEGGTVASPNSAASVVIPTGALPANTSVTVEPAVNVPPASGLVANAVYEFGPNGTTFASPVTITIKYSPSDIPANVPESSLRMYTQVGNDWVPVPGSSVDVAAHTVRGATTHFSRYAPMGTVSVAQIALTPAATSIVVGGTAQLTAVVQDAGRNALTGRSVAWSSADPTRATVSQTGLVTGVAVGTAVITAASEGQTATVTVAITPVPVATIAVTPSAASIFVGSSTALTAVTRDASGTILTEKIVVWSSSDPTKASVTSGGVVSGLAAGTAVISATSEGRTASATITVTMIPVAWIAIAPTNPFVAVGASVTLSPTLRDANSNVLTGRTVTWTSSDPAVAVVSSAGVVTGAGYGTATITASVEGRTATVPVGVFITPAGITITPNGGTVNVGATLALAGSPFDVSGYVISSRTVTWSSLDPLIATVSPNGVVTGVSAGTARIRATVDAVVANVSITVTNNSPVVGFTITPVTATVAVGGTTQLTATATDANGVTVVNPPIVWTSSNPAIATVSSTGTVIGFATGTVTITAVSNGITRSAAVTVIVPVVPVASVAVTPSTLSLVAGTSSTPLTATTRDASFNVLTGRVVTWTSSDPAIATVSSTGVVTGVAIGTANIIATSEGKAGAIAVTVTSPPTGPAPVATVSVTPASPSVVALGTVQLSAVTSDANGNVLSGRVITWTSSNTNDATVSSTGLVTTLRASTVTITATSEGKSGTSTVTVTPIPVTSVEVTPVNQTGTVGSTISLVAVAFSASHQAQSGRTFTWVSSNTSVATVSASGVVTGVTAGTATITATTDGVSGSTSVTFTSGTAPVASLTITPANSSVVRATTLQLTANTVDANGNALANRVVTWSSSNPSVATISSTGLVSGLVVGTTVITAISEGKGATTQITVITPPPATVTVTPATLTLFLGYTEQLTATVKDANGNTLTGQTVVWSVSDESKVSYNNRTGVITATAVGTVIVTATSGGKSGSATVTIVLPPVATVTVTDAVSNIAVGGTAALTATLRDANGATVTNRPITWTTSDASKATVSSTGVVTGAGVGSATITATSEGKSGSATVNVAAPVGAVTIPTELFAISTGYRHACGLNTSGAAYCWGRSGGGALGDGTFNDHLTPVAVTGGLTFSSISVDNDLSCGVTTTGAAYCWGSGAAFALTQRPTATSPAINFASISTNSGHTCGVATDGTGYCVGNNANGMLGIGQSSSALPSSSTFMQVAGGYKWRQIVTSNVATCGIDTTGALYCWGSIDGYRNGVGAVSTSATPVLITNTVSFTSLAHGMSTGAACGLDASGAAYCVGTSSVVAQWGGAASSSNQVPRRVGGSVTFRTLSHYSDNICGINNANVLYCWGNNGRNQLGQGTNGPGSSTVPLVVAPGRSFSQVDLSDEGSVCSVASDGTGLCFGYNNYGQIGDGTTLGRGVPTAVAGGIVFRVP